MGEGNAMMLVRQHASLPQLAPVQVHRNRTKRKALAFRKGLPEIADGGFAVAGDLGERQDEPIGLVKSDSELAAGHRDRRRALDPALDLHEEDPAGRVTGLDVVRPVSGWHFEL